MGRRRERCTGALTGTGMVGGVGFTPRAVSSLWILTADSTLRGMDWFAEKLEAE